MKKIASILLVFALCLGLTPALAAGPAGQISVRFYSEVNGRYAAESITDAVAITLNGAPLTADVPGVVQYPEGANQGRTLIPVRTVAEDLGAQVLYVDSTRQVILTKGSDTIVLTLGSDQATVNGQVVSLPDGVPAGVVKYGEAEYTMVPLRFVSEQLGAQVDWDGDTFTAIITSDQTPLPEPPPPVEPSPSVSPSVTPSVSPSPQPSVAPSPLPSPSQPPATADKGSVLRIEVDDNAQSIFIATDHVPGLKVLDLTDRVVVDIPGATLSSALATALPGGEGALILENECVSLLRFSQHVNDLGYGYDHTVRVVLDLRSGVTYQQSVQVTQETGGVRIYTYADQRGGGTDYLPTVPLDPTKRTVVIDPGHGGAHPGAVYEDIQEKDLTLSMSKKLQAILLSKGYNVVMTREDDTDIGLYERCDVANAVNADVFVSIHCNAAKNAPNFQGLYTFHHPSSNRGKRFAQFVQDATAAATGAVNRGISNNDYVVIRETNMAAVLVETGFMSCHEELMRLCDDAYQQKLAEGIAEGLIRYLNDAQTQEPDPAPLDPALG